MSLTLFIDARVIRLPDGKVPDPVMLEEQANLTFGFGPNDSRRLRGTQIDSCHLSAGPVDDEQTSVARYVRGIVPTHVRKDLLSARQMEY